MIPRLRDALRELDAVLGGREAGRYRDPLPRSDDVHQDAVSRLALQVADIGEQDRWIPALVLQVLQYGGDLEVRVDLAIDPDQLVGHHPLEVRQVRTEIFRHVLSA
jgi:hypothetical protein